MLQMLRGKNWPCAIWFYPTACVPALCMKQRETVQQSKNLTFAKHSIRSASGIPEKLIDVV